MKKIRETTRRLPLLLMVLVMAFVPQAIAGSSCSSDDGLKAKFISSVSSGSAPLDVTFTDESKGDPVSWEWDFGDGSDINIEKNPTHTYLLEGEFIITLTVKDADGKTAITTATIITTGLVYPKMTISFQAPFTPTDVTSLVCDKFAELLDQYTNGNVTLHMFYNETLVKRGQMFEALQAHTIGGALINAGDCRAYDSNLDFAGQLQGLIVTAEHAEAVYSSEEYITFIKNQWDSHDIHYVGYVPVYLIFNYFANYEIDSLWDLAGTKMYFGKQGELNPAGQLQGISEQVFVYPWDLKTAVEGGIVTSQATPPGLALTLFDSPSAFDDTLLWPFYNINLFVFDNKVWNDMPGELQRLIEDVIMPEVKEYANSVDVEAQLGDMQGVLDKMSTAHVVTCKEQEEFWQQLKDYDPFIDYASGMNQDIYDLIVNLRPQYMDFDPIVKEILDQLTFKGASLQYSNGY